MLVNLHWIIFYFQRSSSLLFRNPFLSRPKNFPILPNKSPGSLFIWYKTKFLIGVSNFPNIANSLQTLREGITIKHEQKHITPHRRHPVKIEWTRLIYYYVTDNFFIFFLRSSSFFWGSLHFLRSSSFLIFCWGLSRFGGLNISV